MGAVFRFKTIAEEKAAMSVNTNWDVSKYKSPYEPEYQWELRKKFIELNKDRFCEERIVCLAQTFANIEFMGCR